MEKRAGRGWGGIETGTEGNGEKGLLARSSFSTVPRDEQLLAQTNEKSLPNHS